MYYNLLNATCNLDLPESDRIINKLIVVADMEEEEEEEELPRDSYVLLQSLIIALRGSYVPVLH